MMRRISAKIKNIFRLVEVEIIFGGNDSDYSYRRIYSKEYLSSASGRTLQLLVASAAAFVKIFSCT
jgi:hypothetical protein